jgi:predicted ATPase
MAHTHLENAAAIYNAPAPSTLIFPAGQDLAVLGLSYDAMALWLLGYPEQALTRSRQAISLAEATAQPWAQAMAIGYAALVDVLRGDHQAALGHAGATIRVATEQGVSPWVGRGMMLRGWALAERGQETEGLVQLQQGFAAWQTNGQELGKPFWLGLLGARYAEAGRVAEGLQVIDEALVMAQTREMRVWEAELHRLRGELLLRQSGGESERGSVEACFRQAFEIARRRQAKSLQLRAAVSLGRLWQQRGEKRAAHRCLEESYRWFSEGFDTADLLEAKILLEQLAGGKGSQHEADGLTTGR